LLAKLQTTAEGFIVSKTKFNSSATKIAPSTGRWVTVGYEGDTIQVFNQNKFEIQMSKSFIEILHRFLLTPPCVLAPVEDMLFSS
jgi:hypothetical protein